MVKVDRTLYPLVLVSIQIILIALASSFIAIDIVYTGNPYYFLLEEDYSQGIDIAYAVCIHRDVVYVVGSTGYRMFIDGVSISNGSRLFSWRSDWIGELYDCIIVNSSLFVVGVKKNDYGVNRWFIGLFDTELNLVMWRESHDNGVALSIAYGYGYLYIAGYGSIVANNYSDIVWIVERVNRDDIYEYIYVVSNPSRGGDIASAIEVNPVSGDIWVVGTNGGKRTWRIEVYNRDLVHISSRDLEVPNYPYSIVFNSLGNAYIAGTSHVAKINRDLNIIEKIGIGGAIKKATLYNDTHLVLVIQHSDEYGIQNHYIYILDDDLDIVDTMCVTCGRNYSAYIDRGRVALMGRELYVAGYGARSSGRYLMNTFIIVYAVSIPEDLRIIHKAISGDNVFNAIAISLVLVVVAGLCFVVFRKKRSNNRKMGKRKSMKKKDKFVLMKMLKSGDSYEL